MCVVAEVGKGNNGGVYSDFGSEVRRSDDDVSELEVCHEFGYGDDKFFNKCVRDRLNVGFFVSVDWGVYRCVGDRVGSDDGITFGLNDWSENGCFYGFLMVAMMAKLWVHF